MMLNKSIIQGYFVNVITSSLKLGRFIDTNFMIIYIVLQFLPM